MVSSRDNVESCALSLDETPTEMPDEDDDVDKPNLVALLPFAVTFVPVLPLLPALLCADDETDLQMFDQCEYCEHPFHSAGPAAKGCPLFLRVTQSSDSIRETRS